MGRRWPIGCVALEITQRCNLDCTICYLSDFSEATNDIPIDEIYRQIDEIHCLYGPNTDIQITGGDPTLRKKDELISIVQKIHQKKMRSTLMTNGIKATRDLLKSLAKAGLDDVTFHVDTTQKIKNHKNELSLNTIRENYLDRTKDLGLSVMFTVTIHKDNFHEIPALVNFFIQHANSTRTVSFQLQADIGRGTKKNPHSLISQETVWESIEKSAGISINNNSIHTGHRKCNRYGLCLIVNGQPYDLLKDSEFIEKMQPVTSHITANRKNTLTSILQYLYWQIKHLEYLPGMLIWCIKLLNEIKLDLLKAKGKVTTTSFFIHNFMDACDLHEERIDACVFKIMTAEGPVSMCKYNADRDSYILQPIPVKEKENVIYWHPLSGDRKIESTIFSESIPDNIPLRKLKGSARERRLIELTN